MIGPFVGKYSFLSNFYECPFNYEGKEYPTAEHAFQAAKTDNPIEKERVIKAPSPAMAKKIGKTVTLIPDWDTLRLGRMRKIVYYKFLQNEDLANKLIATEDEELIEINYWGDYFWGVCEGSGKNNLGEILMGVRERLRQGQ